MKTVFLALSVILMLWSIVPYARDILRGTTKPNIVTWSTWTLLSGIAAAAQLAAHENIAAIFTIAATIETGVIVLLGLRHGYVKYTRFDVICQIAAVVGIILWQVFDSPLIGVAGAVAIDFVGALPTLRHAWQRPWEETPSSFALAALGGLCAVAALTTYTWVSMTYAVYIALIDGTIFTTILVRGRVAVPTRRRT